MSQDFILHPDATRMRVLENLQRFLASLPADKAWKVAIARYAKRRSDQQNRYLWGVCYPVFLRALEGWDAEDVHEYMLGEMWGWERLEGMGRVRMKPIKRSSKLSKIEFAEYVDFIQRKAAGLGLYIPDPDPFHDEQREAA